MGAAVTEEAAGSSPCGGTLEFCRAHRPKIAHPVRGLVEFEPYPYQAALLSSLDRGGPHIVLKARQIGISTVVMIQKIWRCMTPGMTVLVVSRKQDMATELLRIARDAAQSCEPELPARLVIKNPLELRWENGSRIVAESASPNTGRAFAASDVVFDEFAFLPWQEEMWRSVRPTVSRGGNICLISTPEMEGDLFHERWLAAQSAGQWRAFRFDWRSCPEYTQAWHEANRGDYTDADWGQEYECEFGSSRNAVFLSEHVRRSVELGARPWETPANGRFVMGVDVAGEGQDASVVCVLETSTAPARVAAVEAWEKLPAPALQERIEQLAEQYQTTPWVDRTGLGWAIVQNLRIAAVGVAITGGLEPGGVFDAPTVPRTVLINTLVLALEHGRIAIPEQFQELLLGLRSYRWEKRRGGRADFVDALAIAWWAETRGTRGEFAVYDYANTQRQTRG